MIKGLMVLRASVFCDLIARYASTIRRHFFDIVFHGEIYEVINDFEAEPIAE